MKLIQFPDSTMAHFCLIVRRYFISLAVVHLKAFINNSIGDLAQALFLHGIDII